MKTQQERACGTCCGLPETPYRRKDLSGKITEGCVDKCHGPHVHGADKVWHERPASVVCREGMARLIAGRA